MMNFLIIEEIERDMADINLRSEPLAARHLAATINDIPHSDSAVSWAAIFAGAAAAAALSLLLMILGTGLGFSVVSPWRMEGISATTFGVTAIAWLSFTQLAASGVGGYLAGRLRTRWAAVHSDEVYFRDTAHGFLTWAIASLLTAVVLASAMGALGGGIRAGVAAVGAAAGSAATLTADDAGSAENNHALGYVVDSLFRMDNGLRADSGFQADSGQRDVSGSSALTAAAQTTEPAAVDQANGEPSPVNPAIPEVVNATAAPAKAPEISTVRAGEVTRIFARALLTGSMSQQDKGYIGQLIAQHTSISQLEAEQRVSTGFTEFQTLLKNTETAAREAADKARKASAYAALWMSVALLLGAFVASLMATFGGRQRDA
jgi:hypothetical protein